MIEIPRVRFLDRTTPPHIITLILLAGLAALTMNIFLPALPGMAREFNTDYRIMQLSVALYLAISGGIQLVIGPISDRLGRRPVLLGGMGLFLVATLGCALSHTVEAFLGFRMLQAAIVVAMVLSRAIVRDMVPKAQAASMIGYVTMGMAVVPMVGPSIGGILEGLWGWHSNFWLLLALGAGVFWLTWADLGETAPLSGGSLRQQFSEVPELLLSPRFWGYAMAAALSSGTFFAYLGGGPFVGDHVFGLDPTTLGFYFGSPAFGYFVGNFISGRYSIRIGINRMVFWGAIINAVGVGINLALLHAGVSTVLSFFGLMSLMGLGNGMAIPNATAGALSVRPHLAGTASGLAGALMIGGGAVLSAAAGLLLTPKSGAFPLLWLMLIIAIFGVVAIIFVMLRDRRLGAQPQEQV